MNIYLKLTSYTIMMLLVPIFFWTTGYQFQNAHIGLIQETTILIMWTLTGSPPYALATTAIFAMLAMLIMRKYLNYRLILILCVLSLVGTQAIKSGMKWAFKEPRPYVVQLHERGVPEELGYAPHSFYEQTPDVQEKMVLEMSFNTDSHFLHQYQSSERGYSFPSGHTIFAVSWLLLFAGLLHARRNWGIWVFQAALIVWAMGVLYTRVVLGMHFPIDLLVSTLIAWVWHLCLFIKILPHLKRRFQAA